jgi:DNA-binding SARP family transcriptional activator
VTGVPRLDPPTDPGQICRGQVTSRLRLLDGFRLDLAGRQATLPQGAQRLLAFLALQARPVHRPFVAGTLWLDKNEERSLANLRTALWRIRQVQPDLVRVRGGRLELSSDVSLDVREAFEQSRLIVNGEAFELDLSHCSLLAGELLPDWYDDWVLLEREHLRQLRLHALEALCWRFVKQHRPAQAIEAGLAAIAAEPMRESAHRAVIAAHLSEGNRSEAIRQYRTFARMLWEALGVRPSDRMEEMLATACTG